MREIIAIPIALVAYVLAVVVIFAFCLWFFDRPNEWQYGIPIITSLVAIYVAGETAENFSSKSGARLVMFIIAAFWVLFVLVDFTGTVNDILRAIFGGGSAGSPDAMDVIMFYIDAILNSKIFAVTSCLATAAGK